MLAPLLWNRAATRLDLVALSHSDPDHSGGLRRRPAPTSAWTEFWDNGHWGLGSEPTRLALEAAGASRHRAGGGRAPTGSDRRSSPCSDPGCGAQGSENDRSLVLRLDWRGISLLLTGDLGAARRGGRPRPLASAAGLTILKVGHHGSRYSSTEPFLDASPPAPSP